MLLAWPSPAAAQAPCRFVLGFSALRDMVGAQKVGNCLEDEHFNIANGNAEQRTTGGLLVWRKIDNFTAFTDGGSTWVNGPGGLQSRLNSEQFAWERDPVQSSVQAPVVPPSAPAPTPGAVGVQGPLPAAPVVPPPPPTPVLSQSKLTPALSVRCTNLAMDSISEGSRSMGRDGGDTAAHAMQEINAQCREIAEKYGQSGYDCYEPALLSMMRSVPYLGRGGGEVAANAFRTRLESCLRTLDR